MGRGLSLDRRAAGQRGAAAANPHGLVQEFLERSDAHPWAIVSNGVRLRILRDNQTLSRQSYLEFDLEAMFAGEVCSDLVLLWLVAHASRFVPREGERPETCWLEQWTAEAEQQGARALGELRGGVERALRILGRGLASHPRNAALRERLRTGALPPEGFHGQLLRVVYRLIFLFVAEDRTLDGQSLLHPRDDSEDGRAARETFAAHYGTARLRQLAGRIKGSRHGDLWRQLQLLADALSGEPGFETARRHLALPALGSFLWSRGSTPELNDAELANHDFLEALRHLAFTRQNKVLRPVDYRNLGAEELGGVYEGLLALTPRVSGNGADFTFAEFAATPARPPAPATPPPPWCSACWTRRWTRWWRRLYAARPARTPSGRSSISRSATRRSAPATSWWARRIASPGILPGCARTRPGRASRRHSSTSRRCAMSSAAACTAWT